MKNIILRIFTFVGILFFVDSVIKGFEINLITTYIIFALLLAVTHEALIPVIKFFTLPINAVSFGLFNFIFSCIYIYFFGLVIPGFQIQDGFIGPFVSSSVQIPEIKMNFWAIIIFSSILITFLNNIVSWTIGDDK